MCGRPEGEAPGFIYLGRCEKDDQFGMYRRIGDPVLEAGRQSSSTSQESTANGAESECNHHPSNPRPLVDWNGRARVLASQPTPHHRQDLAAALGLPEAVIDGQDIGWMPQGPHKGKDGEPLGPCWTFPERAANGSVVGITCRYGSGEKKAMLGGQRGLFIPSGWEDRKGPVLCPEGASCALALTAMSLSAIGRPNDKAGVTHLADLLSRIPSDRKIAIVGEYDPKQNGRWPGCDGAVKVAKELSAKLLRSVEWVLPPPGAKDSRAWVLSHNPDNTCEDEWAQLGQRFLQELEGKYQKVSEPSGVLFEIDAGDLALSEEDLELDFLAFLKCPGYIVRGWSHLLASYPRTGKTELMVSCCRDWLATGERVLYFTEEALTIWLSRVKQSAGPWGGLRLLPGLGIDPLALLNRMKSGTEQIVIVDTARNLQVLPEDENDNAAIARSLGPWIAAAREQHKTLVFLHHMRKGSGDHGEGISGGHALLSAVDIALELRRDNQPDRRVIKGYARLIQPDELLYERTANGEFVAMGNPKGVTLIEVRRRILKIIGTEWMKTQQISEKLDNPRPGSEILRRALLTEAEAGTIERDPPLADQAAGKTVLWRQKYTQPPIAP